MKFHSIYMMIIQNSAKKVMFRNSRWPTCSCMVKTIQTTFSEPQGRYGCYFAGRIWGTALYIVAKVIPISSSTDIEWMGKFEKMT